MMNPQTVARQTLPYKQQWEALLHTEKRPNKHATLTREGDTTTITVSTEPKLTDAATVAAYMSGLAHWARTTPTPRALITPPVAHVKNRRIIQPLALLLWQLNNPSIDIDTTQATYRDYDYLLWQGVTRELGTFRPATVEEKRAAAWFTAGSVVVIHSRLSTAQTSGSYPRLTGCTLAVVRNDPATSDRIDVQAWPINGTIEDSITDVASIPLNDRWKYTDLLNPPQPHDASYHIADCTIGYLGHQEPYMIEPIDQTNTVPTVVTRNGELAPAVLSEVDLTYWALSQHGIDFDHERFQAENAEALNGQPPAWDTHGELPPPDLAKRVRLEATQHLPVEENE